MSGPWRSRIPKWHPGSRRVDVQSDYRLPVEARDPTRTTHHGRGKRSPQAASESRHPSRHADPQCNDPVGAALCQLCGRVRYALYWSIPTVTGLGPVGITAVLALSAPTTTMANRSGFSKMRHGDFEPLLLGQVLKPLPAFADPCLTLEGHVLDHLAQTSVGRARV